MSKIALSLKINVSQIDKARLFKGNKGTYLDATIFVELNELDQYGNSGMITQDVSKDEKQQGVKGNILGNGKVFWVENGQAPQSQNNQGQQQPQQQQAPQQQQQGGFNKQPQQQFNANVPNQGFAPPIQQQQQSGPDVGDSFDDDIPF